MKIAIHGDMKSKKDLVKDVALRLGYKKAPDFMKTSLKERGGGAKMLSAIKDIDVRYYCMVDVIGRMQSYDMATFDFVTGLTYTDVVDEFETLHPEHPLLGELKLLAVTSLSYFDIVFIVPGAKLDIPPEVEGKIKVIPLRGDSISKLTDEIVRQVVDL